MVTDTVESSKTREAYNKVRDALFAAREKVRALTQTEKFRTLDHERRIRLVDSGKQPLPLSLDENALMTAQERATFNEARSNNKEARATFDTFTNDKDLVLALLAAVGDNDTEERQLLRQRLHALDPNGDYFDNDNFKPKVRFELGVRNVIVIESEAVACAINKALERDYIDRWQAWALPRDLEGNPSYKFMNAIPEHVEVFLSPYRNSTPLAGTVAFDRAFFCIQPSYVGVIAMKTLLSSLALALALGFAMPAFAGDVTTAKNAADCEKAGGAWDAAKNVCSEKKM